MTDSFDLVLWDDKWKITLDLLKLTWTEKTKHDVQDILELSDINYFDNWRLEYSQNWVKKKFDLFTYFDWKKYTNLYFTWINLNTNIVEFKTISWEKLEVELNWFLLKHLLLNFPWLNQYFKNIELKSNNKKLNLTLIKLDLIKKIIPDLKEIIDIEIYNNIEFYITYKNNKWVCCGGFWKLPSFLNLTST